MGEGDNAPSHAELAELVADRIDITADGADTLHVPTVEQQCVQVDANPSNTR